MTAIAKGLEITDIQRSTALVDGDDVVDHLGRCEDTLALAFLA